MTYKYINKEIEPVPLVDSFISSISLGQYFDVFNEKWIVDITFALIIMIGGTVLFYYFPITKLVLGPIGVLQTLYCIFLFAFNLFNFLVILMTSCKFIYDLPFRALQNSLIYLISCILFTIIFLVIHLPKIPEIEAYRIMVLMIIKTPFDFLALLFLISEYKERKTKVW